MLQMDYEVLQDGHVLVPNFHLFNDEGVHLFTTADNEPRWRHHPRPAGRYCSTVTIPGNYLAEGGVVVKAVMSTLEPLRIHWEMAEVVGFQMVDSLDSTGVRLDFIGHYPGVVRPWLEWRSEVLDHRRVMEYR